MKFPDNCFKILPIWPTKHHINCTSDVILKDKSIDRPGSKKMIGVQSNHGVEYFGGPAVPT